MKKLIILIAACLAISSLAFAGNMPVLHQIKQVTLSAPYGCNGSYAQSALFLSSYSKTVNGPDLLYNGACGSQDYVEASIAGDDFTLITDLGNVKLENVTASKAFNWNDTVGEDNSFKQTQPVILNHTYAVLISKSDIRALYAFKVVSQQQDGPMKIRYAVLSYSVQQSTSESPGFGWDQNNK